MNNVTEREYLELTERVSLLEMEISTIVDIKSALNSTQSDVKELLAQLNTHLVDDAKSFRTLLLSLGTMSSLLAANLIMAALEHYRLW